LLGANAAIGKANVTNGKAQDDFPSRNVVLQEAHVVAGRRLETLSRAIVARRRRPETPRGPNDAMGRAQAARVQLPARRAGACTVHRFATLSPEARAAELGARRIRHDSCDVGASPAVH